MNNLTYYVSDDMVIGREELPEGFDLDRFCEVLQEHVLGEIVPDPIGSRTHLSDAKIPEGAFLGALNEYSAEIGWA